MKNVVLIRHGQSLAQAARHHGLGNNTPRRKDDPTLQDCFLSNKGIQQAINLSWNKILFKYNFDLICTSPLTRAIATTCLWQMQIHDHHLLNHCSAAAAAAAADDDDDDDTSRSAATTTPVAIVVRAEISEVGSKLPENQGRSVNAIVKDLKKNNISTECIDWIDFSMLPESWPNVVEYRHGNKLESFTSWLKSRQETNIAVVCHCNVIKWLLKNAIDRVPNCEPIECILTDDGRWMLLKSDVSNK